MPKTISSEQAIILARKYLSEQIQIIMLDNKNIDCSLYNFKPEDEYVLAYSFQNELRTGPASLIRISKHTGNFLGFSKIEEE